MPKVKQFVKQEALKYENVKRKYIAGEEPVLHFYNAKGDEVEKVRLSGRSTESCIEELTSRGFKLKPEYRTEL